MKNLKMESSPKIIPLQLMFFLLLPLFIISCERIDTELVRYWKLSETSYFITANQTIFNITIKYILWINCNRNKCSRS